jgi:hypothetical protein
VQFLEVVELNGSLIFEEFGFRSRVEDKESPGTLVLALYSPILSLVKL